MLAILLVFRTGEYIQNMVFVTSCEWGWYDAPKNM